jgi:hypothetical protein
VNLVYEAGKIGGNILERLVGRQVERASTLSVFMKLSALALSYGLPRRAALLLELAGQNS